MSTRFAMQHRRRASTAVFVVITMTMLIGFAALTIDVGYMYNVRTDLQIAADAAALATAGAMSEDPAFGDDMFVPDEESLRVVAQQFAQANHEVAGILPNAGIQFGNWDSDDGVFTVGADPINGVRVITRRAESNSNAVELFFAPIFGVNIADIAADAIAYVSPAGVAFRGLIDNEMFDIDIPVIEALAASLGVTPDDLLSDGDGDGYIDLPPGEILELPTGQVGDEGLFDVNGSFPFTQTSSPSLLDFLLYDYNGDHRGILDSDLDPLIGVEPVSGVAGYPAMVDPDLILVSPVWKSDISNTNPGVNAQGERRGLVAFKIIGLGFDPPGSYLPNLIIEIVSPVGIDLAAIGASDSTNAGLELVQ